MDIVDTATRSRIMASVTGKDTSPELSVRRASHALGYRFRLHRRDLPGKPDLVFPRYKSVIFVHGCFWHMHPGCRKGTIPTSNRDFWTAKLHRNVERDGQNAEVLRDCGWRVLVIWECEARDPVRVRELIARFLSSPGQYVPAVNAR
jgi:DNA mismatch endonuclease, patch repair protein